jgi:hypothetical protein
MQARARPYGEPTGMITPNADGIALLSGHPGKRWATHFVRTLGLPLALAGIAGARTELAILEAEPFRPLPPLEDFQDELRNAVLQGGLVSEKPHPAQVAMRSV